MLRVPFTSRPVPVPPLNLPPKRTSADVQTHEKRRDVPVDGLLHFGLNVNKPSGAFYGLPEVPGGWTEVVDNGVVVVPGGAFGHRGEGYARISNATDIHSLKKAVGRMRRVTKQI